MADDLNSGPRRAAIGPFLPWRLMWAFGLVCVLCPATARAQNDPPQAKDGKPAEVESPLPEGYQPPLDPPEMMQIEEMLLTDEERTAWRKEGVLKKFQQIIRKGEMRSEAAKNDVIRGIRYRLNELTIPANRKNLTTLRGRITGSSGDLVQAGRMMDKPEQRTEFRGKQLLPLVVEETSKLFDNNFYVRIQAALLLGELNLVEEDAGKGIKAEPFPPAYKPLCQALLDPSQPDSVKIVCTLSLIRILAGGDPNTLIGKPNVEQKREIAQAIISELMRKDPEPHPWYQTRLVEALGYNDQMIDLNRNPFIYNCLIAVLNDKDRDLRTRVQAAWSLGRHPEKGPNIPQMIAQVAALGIDLAEAQAKNPKDPVWRRCAWVLYLAFKNRDADDLDAKRDPNRKGGFLAEGSPTANAAKPAYEALVPILRQIIAEKLPSPEQVQDLEKWLETQPDGTPKGNVVGEGNGRP